MINMLFVSASIGEFVGILGFPRNITVYMVECK